MTRIIDAAKRGAIVTEGGTRRLVEGGWQLEIRPRNDKPQSKNVEALLRAKGLSPDTYMGRKVTYEYVPEMLSTLLHSGDVTQDELAACKGPESWTVITPKEAVDE